MGIYGQDFQENHEGVAVETCRKFMDYVKACRLEAKDQDNENRNVADADRIDVRITSSGFPIIPKVVLDKNLKKSQLETIFRGFMSQHYCKHHLQDVSSYQFHDIQISPVERNQHTFHTQR